MSAKITFDKAELVKVKHQHGHRRRIDDYENCHVGRKYQSFLLPAVRWNNQMSAVESQEAEANSVRAIYRFKSGAKWALQNMHKERVRRKRVIARNSKQTLQSEWGGP